MDSLLIVSGNKNDAEILAQLARHAGAGRITLSENAGEASRLLLSTEFDLVLVNTPLPDEFGSDLAYHIVGSSTSSVILVARNTLSGEIADKMEQNGIFVLPKKISRELFIQAIQMAAVSYRRLFQAQKKTRKLQEKMEEIRVVERAKYTLIQYLNMTEPQAHHYIEKRAMDMRQTKSAVAENILKMYEY